MIAVRTLGIAQIDVGEAPILPNSPRKFALVLYLAAEHSRPVPRATLGELLFPELSEKGAQHSVREMVYQVRQTGVMIQSKGDSIALAPNSFRFDFDAFVNAKRLTGDQVRSAEGGVLPGFVPDHSEGFTEWLEHYRARATFDLCKALVADVARARMVGDWTRVELAARACLSLDGYNEEATFALAESLAVGGAKAAGLELLDRYIADVGGRSRDLKLPASVLRRRISERPATYLSTPPSPFVGREREMQLLHEQFALARGGRPQCVAIVGEPGIGKSRLAAEFCNIASLDGAMVAATPTQPHDVHRPFAAFADLQPKLFSLRGALGVSPESMNLLRRLVTTPSIEPASFMDAVRDSESLGHAMTRAIIDLVDAIASEGPLILAIEDFSWLDTMSRRLLGYLSSSRQKRQLFILVTSRDPAPLSDLAGGDLTTLELGGVDADAMASLTSQLVERDSLEFGEEMQRWVQEASGGNPLFLESLLAHYVATRERFSIPPTLSNLLLRRVESLSERATVALQACAILGKYATLDTVVDATALPRYDLSLAIGELERVRLIVTDGAQIRPTHALLSDVVAHRLGPIERGLSHLGAAEALESRLLGDHSAALVWECAEHWMAAGNPARALAAIRTCASHAVEIGRAAEAAHILARTLDLRIDREERLAIARQLVELADIVTDYDLVVKGVEMLRTDDGEAQKADLTLVELRAITRVFYNSAGQERALLHTLGSEGATPVQRLNAGAQLLKYADATFDIGLANSVMEILPQAIVDAVDEPVRFEYCILRDLFRREHASAAAHARALLAVARKRSVAERTSLTLNAMLALYHCGVNDEIASVADSCYSEAERNGAHHFTMQVSIFMAEFHSDLGNNELAELWIGRAEKALIDSPTPANRFRLGISRINRAFALNRAKVAREEFNELDQEGLLNGGTMRARWKKACELRLGQIEAQIEPTKDELRTLMRQPRTTAVGGGVGDLEATVICHCLINQKRPHEAAEFYENYVRLRISRAPLGRFLTDVGVRIQERITTSRNGK